MGNVGLKHPYIRLHGSINRWRSAGREVSRRKVEIQVDDLFSQDIGNSSNGMVGASICISMAC